MFCTNCGAQHDPNSKFCPSCGKELNGQNNNVPLQNNETMVQSQIQTSPIQNEVNVQPIVNNVPIQQENKKGNAGKIIIVILLIILIALLSVTAIIVSNKKATKNTRTIMIYMVGSNLESESGVATADINGIVPSSVDLENIKIYLYTGGTKKWFNFVSSDENAIYELKSTGFEKVKTFEKKNMGDPGTLNDLLTYGYKNSKTDKYDLVLYDHGGAIQGAIYDDFTEDNLSIKDFNTALKMSPFNKNRKLETVLFRTCLNGTIEVANAFKDYADYMIASEEVTVGSGRSSVLSFLNTIENSDSATMYGRKYIDAYDAQVKIIDPLGNSTNSMYSIINLSKIDELNKELDKFIGGVDVSSNYADIVRLRSNLYQFATYYEEKEFDTVDLYELVNGLEPYSSVKTTNFKKVYNEVVNYNWTTLDKAKGISIYFPFNGSDNVQNMFMSIYDDLDYSSNYEKFINNFKNMYANKQTTSFAKKLTSNETKVSKKGEFSLELSDEQAKDYASSMYIVFRKENDGKYSVIYSSNNTKFKDNTLKTNISSNLIKIKLDEEEEEDYFYIPIVERTNDSKKSVSFGALLNDFNSNEISEWKYIGVRMYLNFNKKGVPKISNVVKTKGDKDGVGGAILDLEKYSAISIFSSHYDILDANGNYTENWDSNGVILGYDFKGKELKKNLEKASLEDGDYYCVFKIVDIYGNIYYSKLLELNK